MKIYGEINALSKFKQNQLLTNLQAIQADINGISAEFLHFVDGKIDSKTDEALKKLLTYDTPYYGERNGSLVLVVPRPGTISPWSSKATDIALNSGIDIERVERGIAYYIEYGETLNFNKISRLLHDRMTEVVFDKIDEAAKLFESHQPKPFKTIEISNIEKTNKQLALALSDDEIEYLKREYERIGRGPSDVELMMFAQVNSEHCRHKIFNADWVVDGKKQPKSLFKMIKNTYEENSTGIMSAYSDNAAVLGGPSVSKFYPTAEREYQEVRQEANLVIKAETHNHPTAIAPIPGSATGVGGEIRDEAATGRGAKSKMGFTGFSVSNLQIPGSIQPWEKPYGKPDRIVSALDIMIDAPIGGANYGNEFGRVNLGGYFRTYEQDVNGETWGYHKPLMIAGGLGNIAGKQIEKLKLQPDNLIIVLGGPSMLIGLGGGAGSSMGIGQSLEDLDFASVQRANAEMQRRAQEVINLCIGLEKNPIRSIHDIGAGGLCNGLPELVHDSGLGAEFELRDIPNVEPGMSPMEIWCNESQERFVLAIDRKNLAEFEAICKRERSPFAIVGKATREERLILTDRLFKNRPIDIPMSTLFGNPPKMTKAISSKQQVVSSEDFDFGKIKIEEAVERVLHMPSVGSKKFLITIGDRTVGGMSVRDQMVGPWQVPVSDLAVTSNSFAGTSGEAVAIGERTPLALINAPASGRMAIGEAITNIAGTKIEKLSDIKLSANWMAASGFKNEDKNLFETVKAIGEDFCPRLGLTIPVGKDSLHMRTSWQEGSEEKSVTSPISLIISAFAPVTDVTKTLTPQLHPEEDTRLVFIDLSGRKTRLGGSALAQAYNQLGKESPDVEGTEILKNFFTAIQSLIVNNQVLAYHDRSDGGLITTLCEMAFASRCGLNIELTNLPSGTLETLFNEELGVVIEILSKDQMTVLKKLGDSAKIIGNPTKTQEIIFKDKSGVAYQNSRAQLESMWAETSYKIQSLRDNSGDAQQEFETIFDDNDPGLSPKLTFELEKNEVINKQRPKVAILREQGVNGQVEMAAAFHTAGFRAYDVHMNDLLNGSQKLDDFVGFAACGGFSYGDVLGGGGGWAKTILFHEDLKQQFKNFFSDPKKFSLGVCNGCQMMAQLKNIIPGAQHWPKFLKNQSEQFEARLASVVINKTPSIFFKEMEGSILPVPTAHGEGRAVFEGNSNGELVCAQYVDNFGKVTENYPLNPNGSRQGITALTSKDGRATIIMPHPERVFLTKQLSWHPDGWGEYSPWQKIFQNARNWVG